MYALAAPLVAESAGGGDLNINIDAGDVDFGGPVEYVPSSPSSSSTSYNGNNILWTAFEGISLCADGGWYLCVTGLREPQITVQYSVEITNINSGEVYEHGSPIEVAEGTQLQLRFIPHASEHISWFGTGSSMDSPYGEWGNSANAGGPVCQVEDIVSSGVDGVTSNAYIRLVADAPTKTLTPPDNLSCADTGDGLTYNCVADDQGTGTATFEFAQTTGRFYGAYAGWATDADQTILNLIRPQHRSVAEGGSMDGTLCVGRAEPMQNANGMNGLWSPDPELYPQQYSNGFNDPRTPYTLTIPAQSRQYTIVVGEAEEDDSPGSPSVNPVTVNGDPTACTTNAPYTVEVTATDPQSDDIRYLIDWDADDTVNAYAPSSGYTTSGTTQTASRTFTTEGERSVKVRAQDEHGNLSDWSETFTFTCTDDTPPYTPTVTTASGSQCTPDTAQDVTVSADHASDKEVYYQLDWDRDGATDTRLPATGTVAAGTELTTTHTFTSGDYAFRARAVDEDDIASNWTTITGTCGVTQEECPICAAGSPDVSLSAQPSLVAQDASTTLSWDIAGIDTLQTCSITGTNGDSVSWDTISSQSSYTTPSITIQTTYTLSCTYTDQTLTDTALIFLVPDWQEF